MYIFFRTRQPDDYRVESQNSKPDVQMQTRMKGDDR